MRNQSGFTLTEMMVVIAIIGIVSAFTVPNLIAWRNNAQLSRGARQIYSDLQDARKMAIKNNRTTAIDFGGNIYTLFYDIGDTVGVLDGGDQPLIPSSDGDPWAKSRKTMPPGVTIDSAVFLASGNIASFNSLGFGRDFFNVDNSGAVIISRNGGRTITIRVDSGGSIRIQ
jgi:prepilin-type N-terminal cleavage/methylation domain-containing protein